MTSYKFNKSTNLGEDVCYLSQNEIQNKSNYDYNVYGSSANLDPSMNLALSNQGMIITGGKNITGLQGSKVEQSNKLLLGQKGTHPHDKLSLRQRSYLTVPFLGRGKGNIDAESKLFHGETHCEHKKSEFPDSEKCYIEYSNTPQLPEIEHSISNPDYLVESSGNGWIRGGLPSRELNRDNKVNK